MNIRKSEVLTKSSNPTWLEEATQKFDEQRYLKALEILTRNDPKGHNPSALFLQARTLAHLGRYREAREINHRLGTIWAIFNNLCYGSLAKDTEAIDTEQVVLIGLAVDATSVEREKLFQLLNLDTDLRWARSQGVDLPALIVKNIQRAVEQKSFRIDWLKTKNGYLCVPDPDPFGSQSHGSCQPKKSGGCPDAFILKKTLAPASSKGCVEVWVEG